MARPIDADELKHKIDQEEGRRIEPGWYDGIDTCREIIENAPTIDAIPVGWLEAQIKPYTGDVSDIGKAARNGTIKDIIRKWQKEQEAQDG